MQARWRIRFLFNHMYSFMQQTNTWDSNSRNSEFALEDVSVMRRTCAGATKTVDIRMKGPGGACQINPKGNCSTQKVGGQGKSLLSRSIANGGAGEVTSSPRGHPPMHPSIHQIIPNNCRRSGGYDGIYRSRWQVARRLWYVVVAAATIAGL